MNLRVPWLLAAGCWAAGLLGCCALGCFAAELLCSCAAGLLCCWAAGLQGYQNHLIKAAIRKRSYRIHYAAIILYPVTV